MPVENGFRPRLLDLFSCAGGASMGYHRAGFDVVGVDMRPQPNYPFEFHQGDALAYLAEHGHEFDAVHASPPCHDHSNLATVSGADDTAWLLPATRAALEQLDIPWVIENVEGADMVDPLMLCGTEFGLVADTSRGPRWLRRHRLFESNVWLQGAGGHSCGGRPVIGVYGTGDGGTGRGWKGSFPERQAVMGIDWMNRAELAQALPPAYTEFIGGQLLSSMALAAA